MRAPTCGTCGLDHPDDGRHEEDLVLVPNARRLASPSRRGATAENDFVVTSATSAPRGRRLALVAVAIVGVLGVARLLAGLGDDATNPDPPDDAPTTSAVDRAGAGEPPSEPEAAATGNGDEADDADEANEADEVRGGELASDRVDRDTAPADFEKFLPERFEPYLVVFENTTGLGVVGSDLAVVSRPVRVEAYDEITDLDLFSSRRRTWAVNATDPLESYLVARTNVVVPTGVEARYSFIDYTSQSNGGRPLVGLLAAGMAGPSAGVPPDSDVLAVPGLGVLVATSEGTELVRGARLEPFSAHRVVAATDRARVEERCDGLACALYLTPHEADFRGSRSDVEPAAVLPQRLWSAPPVNELLPILSPDLSWLVFPAEDGARTMAVSLADGRNAIIPRSVPSEARWSPDSQFLAWSEGGRLIAVFPATGELLEMALPFEPADGAVWILRQPG